MVVDIVAVLVAIGFGYAVWRHTRYRSPEQRQQDRIKEILRNAKKRDVGPMTTRYRTVEEQREIADRMDMARRLGYEPPEWPGAATTRVSLDRMRERAEAAARRQETEHPRDDDGRLA